MPTQGSNIPVLSVEKFWLDNKGRGLHLHCDDANYYSGQIAGQWVSGNTHSGPSFPNSGQVLPAASTMGWWEITVMSGTAGGTFNGYIPIFRYKW